MLAAEEEGLRALLGPLVFGVDDETMEFAVAALLDAHGLTLGLAESVTGGLLASRLTDVAGVSGVFRGAVVSYDSEVKFDVLGVDDGPVVTARGRRADGRRRAPRARRRRRPRHHRRGRPGRAGRDAGRDRVRRTRHRRRAEPESIRLTLPGDRRRIREFAAISALDLLRRRLLERRA